MHLYLLVDVHERNM